MTDPLPLSGWRIAVTRPQHQAETLARGIEQLGGNAIRFPLLEITPLHNIETLLAQLSRLQDFDIVIFISPNAARFGMQAIHAAHQKMVQQQVLAVGQGTADALQAQGISQAQIPDTGSDSEALLRVQALQHLQGKRILIFRGVHGRELLAETLTARGANVQYAPCYQRSNPQPDITQLLNAQPDILTVSSSEALQNLWDMLPRESRDPWLHKPLFTIHERISVAARALGWQNVITAGGGDQGLLTALTRWATEQEEKHE